MSLVLVVGAINVDYVVAAECLPGPGQTVVGPRLEQHGGGKGANAAVAAARVGACVALLGAVGADGAGIRALEQLRAEGIDTSGVAEVANEATGAALIVVDEAGENQIAVGAGANAALGAEHVQSAMAARMPGCGCVLVSTEVADAAVIAAVRAALDADVPCVLNPAPVTAAVRELLGSGAILTPNRTEMRQLVGDEPDAQAAALARRTGAPVIATLGADGALIARPNGGSERVTAPAFEARDTTGAGDTFNGVLAARLAGGAPVEAAVRWAVAAATLSVAALGARAGMPSADEIERAMASR